MSSASLSANTTLLVIISTLFPNKDKYAAKNWMIKDLPSPVLIWKNFPPNFGLLFVKINREINWIG